MTRASHFALSTALAALVAGQPALADVTAAQVWDDMEAYMEGFGYSVSGAESVSGDTLTVSDVTMTIELPEGQGSADMNLGTLAFRDRGDGTVEVIIPPVMPMAMSMSPDDEDTEASFVLNFTQSGMSIIVSGDPENTTYTYSAASFGMSLADLVVEGTPVPPEVVKAEMAMTGMSGSANATGATVRTVTQTMNAQSLSYDLAFVDPAGSGNGSFKGGMSNLTSSSTSTLPETFDQVDMAKNFAAGFAIDGEFGYQNGNLDFSVTEDGMTTNGSSSSAKGALSFVMNKETLGYNASSQTVRYAINGGEIPFPLDFALDEVAARFAMPLSTDTMGDFGLGMRLVNLKIPDILWSLGDPGNALPHDPATITFDIAGKAKLLVDIFDPASMAAAESSDEVPAEIENLTVSDLKIAAVGAEVTGSGDFTFDNSDKTTFDGLPRPEGSLNLVVNGANKLIDTLIGMGIVSQEDAMGARLMMSMFTVPSGDDVLTSTIEINSQGHILANGQRIQ